MQEQHEPLLLRPGVALGHHLVECLLPRCGLRLLLALDLKTHPLGDTLETEKDVVELRMHCRATREEPRTAAVGAWVANEGAKIAVAASESEVRAATVALAGVQKEAQGGQRTTVDVLNSQQDLVLAKARLIGAQRDRVIASYTLLSAIGRLDVKTLGLNTPDYLPEVHYHQVRDAWHGLRTPSGQ